MINTVFSIPRQKGLNILLVGAHCDDIEIGCGGTILKLIEEHEVDQIKWVVFTSNETRKEEANASAAKFLESVEHAKIEILDYKDGFLPSVWSDVKKEFERIKDECKPDIIFTHYRNDLHQDHRTLNELTWNTFRNHLILEYEIPKYDGDLGNPNMFVPLSGGFIDAKKEILMDSFKTQQNKQWFDDNLFTSLLRIRGMECTSEYAEAFYCRKMMVS